MQFRGSTSSSSATYRQGIVEEIDRLCDTDDTSYPRADKTSRVNNALETVIGWIVNADGTWQFDDTNYSDQPRGTGTLVEGQEVYSFSSDYLDVEAVEVLDTGTPKIYRRLAPLDLNDLGGLGPEEYFGKTSAGNPQTGFPSFYDIEGDFIRLYPAPTSTSVTLSSGLRVWFRRTASLFTVTTGTGEDTKQAGFASPYHVILAYMASIPYCMQYKKDRVALYEKRVEDIKKEIIAHYGHRETDRRKIMRMKSISYL
jgi:hypothetical protein